jgi:hypothetical protein
VAIVGGGPSGLICAYRLRDRDIVLIEKEPVVGGNARTDTWQGIPYAAGAITTAGNSPCMKLYEELGLQPEPMRRPSGARPYMVDGKLYRDIWQDGLDDLVTAPVRRRVLESRKMLLDLDLTARKTELDRVTLASVLAPYGQEVKTWYNDLLAWFAGTCDDYSGYAGVLLARSQMGHDLSVLYPERTSGEKSYTFPGGLAVAARALGQKIEQSGPNRLITDAVVYRISHEGDGVAISYLHGQVPVTIRASVAIVAAPKFIARHIIADLPAGQKEAMGRFRYAPFLVAGVCTNARISTTVETARVLRWMFLAYLAACLFAYFIPSEVGSNILRLRDAAVPVVVLAVSLRRWRPLAICITLVAMAAAWNLTPRVSDFLRNRSDPTAAQAYWRPAIKFLRANLTPAYRVEVVDTAGHWPAVYLPRAGIPLVRGWFRQDDYPANKVLYSRLGPRRYRGWLRRLGVRYVVLARAPTDYSARAEAKLLRTRRAGLVRVLHTRHLAVYELPSPTPIITGPGSHQVLAFHRQSVTVRVGTPGRYRLAVRYSPYLQAKGACVEPGKDAMVRLTAKRAGRIRLNFGISGKRALAALAGQTQECPLRWRPVRVITGR